MYLRMDLFHFFENDEEKPKRGRFKNDRFRKKSPHC